MTLAHRPSCSTVANKRRKSGPAPRPTIELASVGAALLAMAHPGCAARSPSANPEPSPSAAASADAGPPSTEPPAVEVANAWPRMGVAAETRCHPGSGAPTKLTIEQAIAAPTPSRHESDAYVVRTDASHLAAETPRAACRPFIILSDLKSAGLKEPLSPTQDLVVFVEDLAATPLFSHVNVTYDLCPVPGSRIVGWAATIKVIP